MGDLPDSATTSKLLSSLGHVSYATDLARAVVEDGGGGASNESVQSFASLGAFGKHQKNAERDLHRWTHNLYNCQLEPYSLWLDLYLPDKTDPVPFEIPVLIPFEITHSLHLQGEEQFKISMLGEDGAAGVAHFWENAMKEEWAQLDVVEAFLCILHGRASKS